MESEKFKTESELLADAQDGFLHNACNLCGLAQAFAKVMRNLNSFGHGTDWVNRHAVTKLWLNKMSDLSGYEYMTSLEKGKLFGFDEEELPA